MSALPGAHLLFSAHTRLQKLHAVMPQLLGRDIGRPLHCVPLGKQPLHLRIRECAAQVVKHTVLVTPESRLAELGVLRLLPLHIAQIAVDYEFAFDQANRMIRLRYPMLSGGTQHEEFWGYDRFGRLQFHLDANGKLACMEYDLLNRLIRERHGAPYNVTIEREYDSAGNMTLVDDGTVKTTFSHDALSRMTAVNWFIGGQAFRSLVRIRCRV